MKVVPVEIIKKLSYKNILWFFLIVFILTNLSIAKAQGQSMIYYGFNGASSVGKDWGLSFPNPGETPRGNETADYLREFDAYFVGDGNEKVIYLTFDGGYENGYTDQILDTLKENHVPAAFFLTGNYVLKHPDLICRMVSEGHIVGNHTMSHPDMRKLGKESFAKQLSKVEDAYKSVTGCAMEKFYRPPCGQYSEPNLKMAQELGYKTIFWSLAYNDYEDKRQPSKEKAFSKLVPLVHPGAIILLHSTSKTSTQILDDLIKQYREMGYEFKSLNDLTGYPGWPAA